MLTAQPLLSFLPEYPMELQEKMPGYASIYPYRSLVAGFTTGVALLNKIGDPDFPSIDYLHGLGFGPTRENVIFLPGKSNLPSRRLLEPENAALLAELQARVATLECYSLRQGDSELAIAIGMDPTFVRLQAHLAEMLDDKIGFRGLLAELGLQSLLVEGGSAIGQGPVTALCRKLFEKNKKLVVQTHPRLAGGIGFHTLTRLNRLNSIFSQGSLNEQEMLVTAFEDSWHSPSVNWTITDDGPVFQGVTMQLMVQTFSHAGNCIPSGLTQKQIDWLAYMTEPIARALFEMGYRWDFGLDAILPKSLNEDRYGLNFKLVELNARRVAPYFLRNALKLIGPNVCCTMLNIYPAAQMSSEQIHETLRAERYLMGDCMGGFCVPFMTVGGKLSKPKFAVFCFGESPRVAALNAQLVQLAFNDKTKINFHLEP